jgi:hypothetical protein
MLLEKQHYPDPNLRTYDDSGWTMGWLTHTKVEEIDEKEILDVAVTAVDEVQIAGTVAGSTGDAIAIANYGSNYMVTLRYRLKDMKVEANEEAFEAEGLAFPPGSFIVSLNQGVPNVSATVKSAVEELGLTAAVLSKPVSVPVHEVDLPKLAVYSTWGSTQQVGWVRHALDELGVQYDLIFKERAKAGGLRSAYDVILVPNPFGAGTDISPLLEGLEDNLCQCPHWGYIVEGGLTVTFKDGAEEKPQAGDLFYWPPGHTVRADLDTDFVLFSPQHEHTKVINHVSKKVGG